MLFANAFRQRLAILNLVRTRI